MGLLDTLANILTREPKAKPEYGPMSDALAAQAAGYGVTGGLLNAVDPYILDPMNAPERRWVRQNLAVNSAKDMVAPNADAMERIGMAGIFAGPNAKTANLVALKEAENLAANGADNEAIRQATGWFKGMDGKWRFEIDDSKAFVKGDPVQRVQKLREENGFWNPTINDVLYHKELYDAYPDLKRVPVDFRDGAGGAYGSGHIELGVRSLRDKSTPLHEVEHYVQDIEGFATGGNPGLMAWASPKDRPHLIKQAQELMNEWGPATYEQFWGKEVTRDGRKAYDAYLKDFNSPEGVAKRWRAAQEAAPKRIYDNLAGEIEASDVSARMNLTPEQRMATPPDLRSDAIVRYGNGPQMSAPPTLGDILNTDTERLNWVKNRDRFIENSASKNELYHGTSSSGFDNLDTYRSNYGLFGKGGYLTESPSLASSYTKKGIGTNPGVIPGYADIRNPIDMDAPMSAKWKESPLAKEYGADFTGSKTNEDAYRALEEALIDHDVPKYDGAEMMQDALREMGHDGITHIGGGRVNPNGEKHRVWITFDPEQFKSRFNRGTFDRSNPNFLKSLIPAAAAYGMSEILPYD